MCSCSGEVELRSGDSVIHSTRWRREGTQSTVLRQITVLCSQDSGGGPEACREASRSGDSGALECWEAAGETRVELRGEF